MAATVYLVDDDPLVTDSLGTALRLETPYQIETFQTSTAALAAMPRRPPDVLLTDFKMPGLDGLALLRAVRHSYPDTILILLTGYADKESAIRAINEVGIYQYVEKPWELRDLLFKIAAGLERRDLTRQLRASNAELERRNEELSRSMAEIARSHEALAAAQDRLVASERLAAVGRVVAGIAHELSSQVSLLGYVQAIRRKVGEGDPEVVEYCDELLAAHRRLATMVGEIKDFTRGAGGPIALEPADLAGVVTETMSFLRWDPEVIGREVTTRFEARPLARVHRGKLVQVLTNLVRNAAQASPPDAPIEVALAEADGRAILTVTDRGPGMTPEVLARLGEPFFSTRGERGTGLSLGICRRIAAEHDGSLELASRPGEGTRAILSLPVLA